jgi:hypothetical protein
MNVALGGQFQKSANSVAHVLVSNRFPYRGG